MKTFYFLNIANFQNSQNLSFLFIINLTPSFEDVSAILQEFVDEKYSKKLLFIKSKIQQQIGQVDCGIFVILNAYSLYHGKNLENVVYEDIRKFRNTPAGRYT